MIRIATAEDTGEIQKIYAPYVENTAITFEYDAPDEQEMRHNLCGYKFDKWYSVIWMEKVIAYRPERPKAFVLFRDLKTEEL